MPNPCVFCVNYDDCELEECMKDYCDAYYPANGFTEDDYLDAVIEERRVSFRDEWFAYVENND